MTVTTVFSGTNDGYVSSFNASVYSTARAGSSRSPVSTGLNDPLTGQTKSGSSFVCYEAFLSFDTSPVPDAESVSAVVLSLFGFSDSSVTDFTIEARIQNWGTTITSTSYVAGASLSGLTRVATFATSGFSTAGYNDFTEDGTNFRSAINTTGTTFLIVVSNRLVAGTAPTGAETVNVYYADQAGTTNDPKLVVTSTALNNYVLTAATGTYGVSGVAAGLTRGLKLAAATGSLVETGVAASLNRGLKLTAATGSLVETGVAASLKRALKLNCLVNEAFTAIDAAHISAYNLKAYWPLQGNFLDAIGSNNGTVQTIAALPPGPRQYYTSINRGHYLTFPDTTAGFDINTQSGPWFVAGFINLTELLPTETYTIISKRQNTSFFNWALEVKHVIGVFGDPSGYALVFKLFGSSGIEFISEFLMITDGTDHLVMAYYDPNAAVMGISLDGSVHETTSTTGYITGGLPAHGGDLQIGAENSNGDLAGSFDHWLLGKPTGLDAMANDIAAYLWQYGRRPDIAVQYNLSGQPASLRRDLRLPMATGTFQDTGQSTGLLRAAQLPASPGAFTLTGEDAGLLRGLRLPAGTGAFLTTGESAELLRSLKLPAEAGAFLLTGEGADLLRALRLTAGTGDLSLTGNDVLLHLSYTLALEPGAFLLTGSPAGLTAARRLALETGDFFVDGNAAGLYVDRRLVADPGGYLLSGEDAGLLHHYLLDAGGGSYMLTGNPAGLSQSGARRRPDSDGGFLRRSILIDRTLRAETGRFTLQGHEANLTVKRVMPVRPVNILKPIVLQHYVLPVTTGHFMLTGGITRGLMGRRLFLEGGSLSLQGGSALFTRTLDGEQEELFLLGLI